MVHVALVTVIHDPQGRHVELFKELQGELETIYSEVFITVSDKTSVELIEELEKSKFNVKRIPKLGAAHARREAIKFGLTGSSLFYHYCDFDRVLTWGKNYLGELKEIVSDIPNHDFMILGRTERAFNTHPFAWRETEKIANKIFSFEFGAEVDITSGSCSLSRVSAEYIDKYSKEKMTDAEWAMIVHRMANLQVDYRTVEGLEYHEQINSINQKINDSEEWLGRLRLSLIISETALKTGKGDLI